MSALPPDSQLAAVFSRQPGVLLQYLFGSQVEGRTGPLSDYDFGILAEPAADAARLQGELAHALALVLGTDRIDLVQLNRAPVELAYAVIAQGRLLYEKDRATRVEYEADTASRYCDYLPVLRAQREEILQGGRHERRIQRYRAALERTERTLGEIVAARPQGTG